MVRTAQWSRYALGKALEAYRVYFKADRGWMEAAAVISRALCCNGRTVRNIISDYDGLKALPTHVIEAAHCRGIDLARKRYEPVVKALQESLDSSSSMDTTTAGRIIDDMIHRPKHEPAGNSPFVPLTPEEKSRWKIRIKIRTALNNIETERKLPELIAALEEEMFAVWGQTKPVTVTITPRKSSLTLDGKKRRA